MSTGETGYICMLMTRTVLNSDFVEQVRIRCIVIPDSIKTIGILCLLEVIFPVYMQLLMRRGGLDDLDELVYLQTEDKLIYVGPPGFWPESALLIGGGDFEKVKIRNKRKYMHFLMNMP